MTNHTELQYRTPTISSEWASSRETDKAVAMAIHAIASGDRTPEAIWEDPSADEWDHVVMAVENYVAAGVVEYDATGYCWGQEIVRIEAPTE